VLDMQKMFSRRSTLNAGSPSGMLMGIVIIQKKTYSAAAKVGHVSL
jgi:hypothetical protein